MGISDMKLFGSQEFDFSYLNLFFFFILSLFVLMSNIFVDCFVFFDIISNSWIAHMRTNTDTHTRSFWNKDQTKRVLWTKIVVQLHKRNISSLVYQKRRSVPLNIIISLASWIKKNCNFPIYIYIYVGYILDLTCTSAFTVIKLDISR